MAKTPGFTPIPMQPLIGMLDTHSRPAEMSPGSFRYKLNFAINRSGQLSQRAGFGSLDFGQRSDSEIAVNNWDFHRQGASRELPVLLLENTAPDGVRSLFAGTASRLSVLDNSTSEWTHIATGKTGERWKGASLEDRVYFTNNVDEPLSHELGSGTTEAIPELAAMGVTKAKVVISFGGVVVWMNVEGKEIESDVPVGDSKRISSRVVWSNYRDGMGYNLADPEETAGFQDLDYGDDILNAIELFNAVYIFTTRSIWRMTVSVSEDTVFAFQRIYSEPKNKTGCLAYPNTLVSNGRELFWWSYDTIWTWNPYIVAPESPEWLLKCSGHVYSADNSDRMDKRCCESPIGEYHPNEKEIWFSYPLGSSVDEPTCFNNRSLVVNHVFKTADIVDHGFGAFVNYSRSSETGQDCRATQVFIGSSGTDFCLKSIGGVFHREMVTLLDDSAETDIPDVSYTVTEEGYYRRIVGQCPFGYPDKQKTLNGLTIQHDTKEDDNEEANLLTLRIGNSYHIADPMLPDARCSVQWHTQDSVPMECPDPRTMSNLAADNLRPDDDTGWEPGALYEQGIYLYFDIRITAADGDAPVGSDSAWSSIMFSVATDS